jgi:aspartate/methionine/tyrosine aminotransferase
VHSLSKRSNLAGYRAGFAAGDATPVAAITEARKHLGLLVPHPCRPRWSPRWATTRTVAERGALRRPREVLLPPYRPPASPSNTPRPVLYLWCTRGEACWETVQALASVGVLAAPGEFYGEAGAQHVRFALTATDERIAAAAERLSAL